MVFGVTPCMYVCDILLKDLTGDQVPCATEKGVSVKILSGEAMGVRSDVKTLTPTTYLDFRKGSKNIFKDIVSQWEVISKIFCSTFHSTLPLLSVLNTEIMKRPVCQRGPLSSEEGKGVFASLKIFSFAAFT